MPDPCFPGSLAPAPLSYFTATVSVILAIITTVGNCLIIVATIKDPHGKLRSSFAFFLANMALSDLIVGLIAMPVSVMFHYLEAKRLINMTYVYIVHMTYFISLSASLFSMAALCFDRYYAFISLSTAGRQITRRRCIIISIAVWVFAIAFTGLYFIFGYVTLVTIYIHLSFVCIFGITLLTYLKIMRSMKKTSEIINKKRLLDILPNVPLNLRNIEEMTAKGENGKENGKKLSRNLPKEKSVSNARGNITDASKKIGALIEQDKKNISRKKENFKKANLNNKQDNQEERYTKVDDSEVRNLKIKDINKSKGQQRKETAKPWSDTVKQSKIVMRERRLTSVFLTMLVTFLSSYFPALVSAYFLQLCLSCSCDTRHVFRDIAFLMLPTGSALNAVICILKMSSIKEAVKIIFRLKRSYFYSFNSSQAWQESKLRSPIWYRNSPKDRKQPSAATLDIQRRRCSDSMLFDIQKDKQLTSYRHDRRRKSEFCLLDVSQKKSPSKLDNRSPKDILKKRIRASTILRNGDAPKGIDFKNLRSVDINDFVNEAYTKQETAAAQSPKDGADKMAIENQNESFSIPVPILYRTSEKNVADEEVLQAIDALGDTDSNLIDNFSNLGSKNNECTSDSSAQTCCTIATKASLGHSNAVFKEDDNKNYELPALSKAT